MTSQPSNMRSAIAALGNVLGPDVLAAVQALYRPEHERLAAVSPITAADVRYGGDARQALDLYRRVDAPAGAPILLWVHGGGFLRGDKQADGLFNAHVGRWAAAQGMVGAVMNYRLAPDHVWPAGGEDVGLAIDWLRAHAAQYGGNPDRLILAGTSAGAVHIATQLMLRPDAGGARAAVLLSGLYGFTPLDQRDTQYYGPSELYDERQPLPAMVASSLPLMFVGAEFDPPRFQAELVGMLAARLETHGLLPRAMIASGHNHFSLAAHLGTGDTRLADEILAFIGDHQ